MKKAMIGLLAALALTLPSQAQEFPTKPIRIIVPYSAGGGTDIMARVIASKFQDMLGQTGIVENRTGAGGNLGAELVFTADPDGHTLMFTAQGPLAINKTLYEKLSYDPDKFTPVSLVATAEMALLANPKMAARSVSELIAFGKANPEKLNYASQGIGTSAHLTAELFKTMAGIKIVHVPYRGSAPALIDLVAGHVNIMFAEIAPAHQYLTSGSLRALGVTGERRVPSMPDVPTVAETLPGFAVKSWWGMVAPPGTPPAIANKLSVTISKILKQPDVVAQFVTLGANAVGNTPEELERFMVDERGRWSKVIRESGATAK